LQGVLSSPRTSESQQGNNIDYWEGKSANKAVKCKRILTRKSGKLSRADVSVFISGFSFFKELILMLFLI